MKEKYGDQQMICKEEIIAVLAGSFDLHTHTNPSHFCRAINDFELVEQANSVNMAGVMIKSHYEPTASRAALVNQKLGNSHTKAYGGIALNYPAGGLNPYAVESCLKLGGKFVWMPTRDAANSLLSGDMPGDFYKRKGIDIIDEDGKLLPACYEIMEVIKKYDAVLATGHISPRESILLCIESAQRGVKTVLTHPEFSRTEIPIEEQLKLARLGVFIEKCWYNIDENECTAKSMANHICTLGSENCFMTTDRGQQNADLPVQAMIRFVEEMLNNKITVSQINDMIISVPKQLLG